MPHRNRVDPFGKFHEISARGTLMGNRGMLHDRERRPMRTHAHRNWIACALAFKDRKRSIMAPGRYTELFFLDEATAFAAGHRPCAECRRERYDAFARVWRRVHGAPEAGRTPAQGIDRILHAQRIARGGRKVTFDAPVSALPDGTIFAAGGRPVLIWRGRQFDWAFDGYAARPAPVHGTVTVLTPRPVVALFAAGFRPSVQETPAGGTTDPAGARA